MKRTTDQAILKELGRRLRRERIDRDITQAALAREAGISKPSVERLEAGHSVQLTTLIRVLRALEMLGNLDLLVPEQLPSPVELLEREGAQRERASSRRTKAVETPWTWEEE